MIKNTVFYDGKGIDKFESAARIQHNIFYGLYINYLNVIK